MALLYVFRSARRRDGCSTRRYGMFINAISIAYYEGQVPEEIMGMVEQFENDNDEGRCTTQCKMKADTFLSFVSTLDGWDDEDNPTGTKRKNRHPLVWSTLPIGGEDPRGR